MTIVDAVLDALYLSNTSMAKVRTLASWYSIILEERMVSRVVDFVLSDKSLDEPSWVTALNLYERGISESTHP